MEDKQKPVSGFAMSDETQKLMELLRIVYDALEENNGVVSYTLHFHESPNRETMLRANERYLDAQLAWQQARISFAGENGELDLDFAVIGPRLKQYREEVHIPEDQAAKTIEGTIAHLEEIEAGTTAVQAHELFLLAELYGRQVFEIVQGPLPYETPDEILAAWDRGAISEGVASHALHLPIIEARAMLLASRGEESHVRRE